MKQQTVGAILAVGLSLALAGCNLPRQDTASVQTAAALTVQAQLTAVAPSPVSTSTAGAFPTLPPSATAVFASPVPAATATPKCDVASFVKDVTIPDNTSVDAGADFTKTWRLKNDGDCSWTPSYQLVFVSGQIMDGASGQALSGNVNKGDTVDVSVTLTAPTENGSYQGNWGLKNAAGTVFANFWVKVRVEDGIGGPFAVTHVTYSFSLSDYSGHDDCPMMTAHITTNGAGDVVYRWTRSDGAGAPLETVHFGSAGTKDVETHWALGSVWEGETHWLGIYVDEPNHQDFGHKTFTKACAP